MEWAAQNIVIAGILALVVQIVCRLGRIGPVGRHALWLIVLVKLVTPPVLVLRSPWAIPMVSSLLPQHTAPVDAGGATSERDVLGSVSPSSPSVATIQSVLFPQPEAAVRENKRSSAPRSSATSLVAVRAWLTATLRMLLSYVAIIWIGGGFVFASVQAFRIARVLRGLRRAAPPAADLVAAVELCQRRMGIRSIRVRVVPDLMAPMIWSANPFCPRLLWPVEMSPRISEECRRALIVHELAHLGRRDHWVGWLELAAGCAHWWNPLFWYVRSQLRENAELACDGWVVNELPHGRRAYADAVLLMCARMGALRAPMTVVGISTGGRRLLERRLAMIMQDHIPLRLSRTAAVSVVMFTLAALPAWAQRAARQPIAESRSVAAGDHSLPLSAIPSMPHVVETRAARALTAPTVTAPTRESTFPPIAGAAGTVNQSQQLVPVVDPAQAPIVSALPPAGWGVAAWRLSLDEALKVNEALGLRAAGNPDPAAVPGVDWDLVYAIEGVEVSLRRLGASDPSWTAQIASTDHPFNPGPVDLVTAIRRAVGDAPPADPTDAAAVGARQAVELRVVQDVTASAITLINSSDAVRAAQKRRGAVEQQLKNRTVRRVSDSEVLKTMVDLPRLRSQELIALLNYQRAQVAFQQLQESGSAISPAR